MKTTKNTNALNPNFDSRAWINNGCKVKSLGIFGSRTLNDQRVTIKIMETVRDNNITTIHTCGEPEGVSECARIFCRNYGYPLQLHFLNMQYLRGAFDVRSKEILKICDMFLIIHDGKSKGTANEYELAQKTQKPVIYCKLKKTELQNSVAFSAEDIDISSLEV